MGHSMAVKQKKRRWPDEEKRSVCLQTMAQGVSVARFARRIAMSAHLIFKWLKENAKLKGGTKPTKSASINIGALW